MCATTRAARPTAARARCRADVLDVLRKAGEPLMRKQVQRALADRHGEGTVSKALAELVRAGVLANDRSKNGYTLADGDAQELRNVVCPRHGCRLWFSAAKWLHCPQCVADPVPPPADALTIPVIGSVRLS